MLKVSHPSSSGRPVPSPGQRVSRKYRKAYMRKLRRKEYTKLRAMVPSVAAREKVSKVKVIEEAIKYIEELHGALASRLKSRGVPAEDLSPHRMADLVRHLVPYHVMMAGVKVVEKQQDVATYVRRKLHGQPCS